MPLKNRLATHPVDTSEGDVFVLSTPASSLKVLVVEDNLVNQELALIYLNILKCDCDLANNGEEAILKLTKQS